MPSFDRGRLLVALALTVAVAACESGPEPRTRTVQPAAPRDVAPVLRNTVGAIASMNGVDPVIVSGYGLVVGLNGTGGQPLREDLASIIEREMGLKGIGQSQQYEGWGIDRKSPTQLLRDKNVAVVLVQAAIPPGSPAGMPFDVYVTAVNASSLEGGRLWSTDLQIGEPAILSAAKTARLAIARGPIFINPFSDPAGDGEDGVTRRSGRILSGGVVTDPLRIEILLDEPSHARARAIVDAINTRFPEEPGQRLPTARGRSGDSIALSIPPGWTRRPGEFINVVKHVQLSNPNPDAWGNAYINTLRSEPAMADAASYSLQALGDPAIKFARELYDAAEPAPRMAALRAGARLGDPQSARHLIDVAERGTGAERLDAIALLAEVDGGPNVDLALRRLVQSRELLVRVAAYEALTQRAEAVAARRASAALRAGAAGDLDANTHIEVLTRGAIPPGGIQGIQRRIVGDKFVLDVVDSGEPLIYVTQQGRPKIVLFGGGLTLQKPVLASAWNDRLMITAESESDSHRLYYRDWRSGQTYRQQIKPDLDELILFLARRPTPEDPTPGLNLTYSEVVGALRALHMQRAVAAAFATESDKLKASILEATVAEVGARRPETLKEREEMVVFELDSIDQRPKQDLLPGTDPAQGPRPEPAKPRLVPILRPTSK